MKLPGCTIFVDAVVVGLVSPTGDWASVAIPTPTKTNATNRITAIFAVRICKINTPHLT
jgi:hypothetical protein